MTTDDIIKAIDRLKKEDEYQRLLDSSQNWIKAQAKSSLKLLVQTTATTAAKQLGQEFANKIVKSIVKKATDTSSEADKNEQNKNNQNTQNKQPNSAPMSGKAVSFDTAKKALKTLQGIKNSVDEGTYSRLEQAFLKGNVTTSEVNEVYKLRDKGKK